jgi:hypothetical protein
MWTLIVFMCLVADQDKCYQTGPQTVFPTEQSCNVFFEEQSGQLQDSRITVQHRCIGWGKPT